VFASRLEYIRKLMPNAFIGADVIVGFPGETDEDFNDTYQFLEELAPSFLHIFPYSERPNTSAINMDGKVNPTDINNRIHALNQLCRQLHTGFYKKNVGKTASVLFESSKHGNMMHGFTESYIKVEVPYQKNLSNIIISVKLTGLTNNGNMQADIITTAE
jgi:threonylcarbamoyladenosine tRNA methylthiotransferase MtaB